MSKVSQAVLNASRHPARVVLFILGVALAIMAISMGGPWYHATGSVEGLSSIGMLLDDANVRVITGVLWLIPASMAIWGVTFDDRRWAYWGAFGIFLAYMFMAVFAALSFGFENAVWISRLALSLIAGVVTLAERDTNGVE